MKALCTFAAAMILTATSAIPSLAQASSSPGGSNAFTISDLLGIDQDQLAVLVMKMPPHGPGLTERELRLLGSRLSLTEKGMRGLRNRLGCGGTGFSVDELRMFGWALGLSNPEIAQWDTYTRSKPSTDTQVASRVQLPGSREQYILPRPSAASQLAGRADRIIIPNM